MDSNNVCPIPIKWLGVFVAFPNVSANGKYWLIPLPSLFQELQKTMALDCSFRCLVVPDPFCEAVLASIPSFIYTLFALDSTLVSQCPFRNYYFFKIKLLAFAFRDDSFYTVSRSQYQQFSI